MNKIFLIIVLCHIILLKTVNAQSVGIGTNAPKASAVLDVTSTNKGILFPRMTTAERNAIINPADGLHIFNINSRSLESYDSLFAVWEMYCTSCKVYVDTIKVNTTIYIVPAGWRKYKIVINPGVSVIGNFSFLTPDPAIVINADPTASIIIENYGSIYGIGGKGGKGGGNAVSNANITCNATNPLNGGGGGNAIYVSNNELKLTVYNHGIIAGGGGGGGGGNYGTSTTSAGGGGGGGQGAPSLGGEEGNNREPYVIALNWDCRNALVQSNATAGGAGSFTSRGNFGTGSTGTGGGSRGGFGGTLAAQGQAGFGSGGNGGVPGKAVYRNNIIGGNTVIINIGAGVVYGVVE